MMDHLNNCILEAHAEGNKRALAELYHKASQTASSIDSACFFATQAYIFALECNHALKFELHAFLTHHGREE